MAKEQANEVKLNKVWVVAKQPEGRWGAGMQFTQEPREVELTDEQLKQIEADPVLQLVMPPKPADAKPAA
jgi:hypothetical protein